MATQIARLDPCERTAFNQQLDQAIRLYPGNISKTPKTIANWRTEISALFGFIVYDESHFKPGKMSLLLAENQDLVSFFRYFLYYFQYPGGHLKTQETLKLIQKGVRFKPAKYLIQVLLEGKKQAYKKDSKFGINKAEATHCIFNDLRVSRDGRSPKETVALILENRDKGIQYDCEGDVVRYAGDILDYMVLGDLVTLRPNSQYYLNTTQIEVIDAFNRDTSFFEPYQRLYPLGHNVCLADIKETQSEWFDYVNSELSETIFQADALSIIEEFSESEQADEPTSKFVMEVINKIRRDRERGLSIKTKEIGDTGEALTIEHEKNRLRGLRKDDLLHLVVKMPESLGVGYDIKSYEGTNNKFRFIEVKSTISIGKLATKAFSMTTNEWRSAKAFKEQYFIYRIMISKKDITLFVIQDPVGKEREELLEMMPRKGADITYTEHSGYWENLLV